MTRNGSGLFRFGMMVFATAAFLAACSPTKNSDDDDSAPVVVAPGGGSTGTAPVIALITPGSGAVGATVDIFGSDFGSQISDNVILFGTKSLAPSSATATQLTFLAPPSTPGSYLVSVTTGNLSSNGMPFTLLPPGSLSTGGSTLLNSVLSVSVINEISQLPIANATVRVDAFSGSTTAQTDGAGMASIPGLTGPLTLTAGKSGYALLSFVGVNASQVTMALEPLAMNHVVSGSIVLPNGVPTFAPDGTSAANGLQWSAFVTADHEPRFSPLRGGQAPFSEPNTGGNGGGAGQTLDFKLMVYEGEPFRLVRGLSGAFASAPLMEIAAYEVISSSHGAIYNDLDLGALSFQTAASNNGSNVDWLLLSNNDNGSVTGLPAGSLGSEFMTSMVRGTYADGPATPAMGMWTFSPFASAGNLFDSYHYNDPAVAGLQIVTGVVGNNGSSAAYRASSASYDVQALSQTNPSLPQNVALPVVPTVISPSPGAAGIGLTPAFGWSDALGGSAGFYELTLDQVDGTSVRGWRLILSPSTTSFTLPSLGAGFGGLAFQQGSSFASQNQVRFVLSAVRMAAGFDFNDADFGSAFANDHRVGKVSLGYAP